MNGWKRDYTYVPGRNTYPLGRLLTVVIDSRIIYSRTHGVRPESIPVLSELVNIAEVIIICDPYQEAAGAVLSKLDQTYIYIVYPRTKLDRYDDFRLYRNVLALGNRDPKKTIILDSNPDMVVYNPENALICKEYDGSRRSLEFLIHFVQDTAMKMTSVPLEKADVRRFIEKYHSVERDFITMWDKFQKIKGASFLS